MTIENFSNAVPVIGTSNVIKTISYFEQTLGFKQQWVWGEPPVYAGVRAGAALLYISSDPALATAIRERQLTPIFSCGSMTLKACTPSIARMAPRSRRSSLLDRGACGNT